MEPYEGKTKISIYVDNEDLIRFKDRHRIFEIAFGKPKPFGLWLGDKIGRLLED